MEIALETVPFKARCQCALHGASLPEKLDAPRWHWGGMQSWGLGEAHGHSDLLIIRLQPTGCSGKSQQPVTDGTWQSRRTYNGMSHLNNVAGPQDGPKRLSRQKRYCYVAKDWYHNLLKKEHSKS